MEPLIEFGKTARSVLGDVSVLANRLAELDLPASITFLVAIVSRDLKEESRQLIIDQFGSIVKGAATPIELRVFDFEELLARFGVTSDA